MKLYITVLKWNLKNILQAQVSELAETRKNIAIFEVTY